MRISPWRPSPLKFLRDGSISLPKGTVSDTELSLETGTPGSMQSVIIPLTEKNLLHLRHRPGGFRSRLETWRPHYPAGFRSCGHGSRIHCAFGSRRRGNPVMGRPRRPRKFPCSSKAPPNWPGSTITATFSRKPACWASAWRKPPGNKPWTACRSGLARISPKWPPFPPTSISAIQKP